MNPTIDVHLETAICRCNDGVALLLINNFEGAITSFSSSLRLTKQILNDPDVRSSAPKHDESPSAMRGSLLDSCMAASSEVDQGHIVADNTAVSYIHHQAIRFLVPNAILEECCTRSNSIDVVAVVLSKIIMFNLALAYQLAANGSEAKLRKSLRLYALAFSFQNTEELTDSVMFTMATLNNSGLIHEQFGNQEASQICFEELLSTIMCVVDYGREGTAAPKATSCNLEGFLKNTFSVFSKPLPAPAA
jgi:hypothetical protein